MTVQEPERTQTTARKFNPRVSSKKSGCGKVGEKNPNEFVTNRNEKNRPLDIMSPKYLRVGAPVFMVGVKDSNSSNDSSTLDFVPRDRSSPVCLDKQGRFNHSFDNCRVFFGKWSQVEKFTYVYRAGHCAYM